MLEQRQNFLKGINRRFSREDSSNPEFFYTLQNARIYNRGDTGKVSRIKGYDKFVSTATDYTNTLDVITLNTDFIVLYKDAITSGQFYVDIFNSSGGLVQSLSYTGEDISVGKLTKTNDTVFIAPHNKVLYYDGSWSLEDFKSGVPTIQEENEQAVTVNKATATIEPTSAPSNANISSKATAELVVNRNNTVQGRADTVTLTVGANTTAEITINYEMSEYQVAQEFYYALRGENGYTNPGVTTDWDVSLSKNKQNQFVEGSRTIYFTSLSADPARNNDEIDISGNEYIIIDRNFNIGGKDERFTDDRGHQIILPEGDGSYRPPRKPSVERTVSASVSIDQPSGAISPASSFIGPLYIRLDNINHTVTTENITTADTVSTLASKIKTALDNDSTVTDNFLISGTSTITITANNYGEQYNGVLSLRFRANDFIKANEVFSYNKTNFTGGQEVDANLGLKKETDYWYKARYKYIDGHVSEDCFPIRINTGSSQMNPIVFETNETDLDGSLPKLQIFRKEEGNNFFLVEEMDVEGATTDFLDDGEVEKGPYNDASLVWTKNHKTQTILDNRLVRANITYDTQEYTIPNNGFVIGTENTSGEETMPSNSKARFYVRPQYSDGTKGYYENIGVLDVNEAGKLPTIQQQNGTVDNPDKTIEELGFYVNYRPHSQEHLYRFNSVELANRHISTIQDSSFYPSSTRIFLGFKYLEVWEILPNNDSAYGGVFKAVGWDSSNSGRDHGGFVFDKFDDSGSIGGKFPKELTVDIFGVEFTYVRHGYFDSNTESTNAIYRLADYDAIKKAVSTGNVKIRLTGSNVGNLSTKHPDNEIINEEVKVKSFIDKSAQYDDLSILNKEEDVLIGPLDSRLYLELEESTLDDIDNVNLTKYSLRGDYGRFRPPVDVVKKYGGVPTSKKDLSSFTMSWEITNLKKVSDPVFDTYTGEGNNNDGGRPDAIDFGIEVFRYSWDYSKYELTSSEFYDIDETAIFIGRKENEIDASPVSFPVSGIKYEDDNEISYGVLIKSNIYDKPIFKSDFNIDNTEEPTQLIWSEPLMNVSGFSGGRTFNVEAFFSVDNENGEILQIESLGNKLYVFCENGIAQVNVGEVLTTQKEGQVHVDSSTFMTNYYWINDRLVDIKRESIVKYKNVIYFTDGYDVFRLGGQGLQNLTQGFIKLDPNNDYYGNINPKYSEYQICDYTNGETWVYNFEFQQWYGPFTYKFKNGNYVKHKYVTVDDTLYEHNIGNTFNGASYETVIQSVANDTEISFYDKDYRKFYIQTNGDGTFKYGKTVSVPQVNTISTLIEKNGYRHQGIAPTESNSKVIYWEIATTQDGFELRDIAWRYHPKKRR